jgi:glucosyl-3-phosphoglycerate synthase
MTIDATTGGDPAASRWVATRTWDGRDVTSEEVRRHLAQSGRQVSVVIPALDEEATIGRVVSAVTRARDAGLVHEIVVVDGGSEDGTPERAAAAGATVLAQDEIVVSDAPPAHGKGDALWKGVAATSGELVVFIDADVVDLPTWWVAALVAPLCTEDGVALVKASYHREGGEGDTGGGRVTELVARPLINLFWPDLAGIHQPLAGEYAGRRDVLERLPFPTGYGVELAILLEVATRYGVDAVAQVRLGARAHAHQPLSALTRMAAEVLHAAAVRLELEGRLSAPFPGRLVRPSTGDDLEAADLRVLERPPLSRDDRR